MSSKMYFIFTLVLFSASLVRAADAPVDKLVVPWSDPGQPGMLEVGLINGGMTVEGYDGKEVMIESQARSEKIEPANAEKVKGLRRIPVTGTGLSVEEEQNSMEISVDSHRRTVDLAIKVPFKTSLKLSCVNAGDILVKNVEGELEINNINGGVTLENISGAVVAHALNQDLIVTFKKILPEKAMSFSSMNGNVDVTFPANTRANLKMKSDNGEIYTDFEVKIKETSQKIVEENKKTKPGKYEVRIDKFVTGLINGGGAEYQFTSFNGDIFIRQRK